ncbi:Tubby-like F-box protein 5 [Hibiscus syriacus]|uniref:Tubby-like F-box protein 5 n=1 Tax=Hibiscus syriacus TaxID=106335 RepID=A0A6A2Y329_HIBSY|nr:Tubby-like F-box protein 5 [Hibiscus syriacus]
MEEPSSPPEEPLREPGADGDETGLFIHQNHRNSTPMMMKFQEMWHKLTLMHTCMKLIMVQCMEFSSKEEAVMAIKNYNILYNGPHTCCARGVNQDHPNLDSEMICQAIMPMVKTSSHIAVAVLISAIQSQYGYIVSHKKAWLAKQNAIVKLNGEWDASYNELSDRGAVIKAAMESLGPMWQPPFIQHSINNPPINCSMHARAYILTSSSEASALNSRKLASNQFNGILPPIKLSGTRHRLSRHKVVQEPCEISDITSPSTGSPRCIATSSSVIVHSPHGRWNVWVSGLHRSTKAEIRSYLKRFLLLVWITAEESKSFSSVKPKSRKMPLKAFIREIGNISKNSPGRKDNSMRGRSHIAPEASSSSPLLLGGSSTEIEQGHWTNLPPELLLDILQRVETKEKCWPGRRDVVACSAVCKSWREITKEIVKTPEQCGFFTFPISLKQPGPREAPIQCLLGGKGKLQRIDCIWVSVLGGDFSKSSNDYIGKLRSNFLGTKFNSFESQPQHDSSAQSGYRSHWKTYLKSEEIEVCNVLYPVSAVKEGGTAPTPMAFANCPEDHPSPSTDSKGKTPCVGFNSSVCCEPAKSGQSTALVLKNKAPRWHEQLQCWCLNFKGRVTVASVKNFQLVANVEPSQDISVAERDKVILQFGKIGKDIFTMDYRYPLSAFQAFAICLSSFGTKPVCE